MDPINVVAERLGIDPQHLIPFGNTKAKVSLDAIRENGRRGKLVVVTGITPTPAGEGKTTTSIGLTDGLGRLGHQAVVNLREPALGPIFGIKGGGTGGGKARVVPEDEINIHFTGDAHAVGSTHNLLAALVENAVYRNRACDMAPDGITWSRVTDASDRALRQITSGLGGNANSPLRETRFDFITASEIMAILALATDLEDLRARLSRIVVGTSRAGDPVSVGDLGLVGPLMAVMRHTVMPNLVQTMEGMPAIVHSGPFGNIAHGCSSIIADRLALGYADIIITEAGFASDLGFEKFMHIKTRNSGLPIAAAVLVSSVRAMRWHGGALRRNLSQPDLDAMKAGAANMVHHINIVRSFGLPVVVALNRFDGDSAEELQAAAEIAEQAGAYATAEYSGFTDGGEGGVALAEAVARAVDDPAVAPDSIDYAYDLDASIEDKVLALARRIYGAERVTWTAEARRRARFFAAQGWDKLPICMAKTHLSISHDPTLKGSPSGYTFPVSDIRASVGAGFLYTLAGRIETLPGLPTRPRAVDMDVSPDGEIVNL
ncbi:MAG: formate--tetrahydrofolate ligase [Chloroflexota bacterium]|nr:formate--tetrahydrofolate ligase [Chloroflexota bacterium]MDE2961251.1 formate--tetrahydrofolate ligase [Chloroflexota bacterium]